MSETVQKAGLYVRLGAAEYRVVVTSGSWALWSAHPVPQFTK